MATSFVARQLGTNTEKTRGRDFFDSKLERFENPAHFLGRDGTAELAIEPVNGEQQPGAALAAADIIRRAADQPDAGRDFLKQSKRALKAADGVHRVLGFFEAHGGVGAELEARRRFANTGRVEIGAFENNPRGGIRNRAVRAADDAGDGDGPARICDHEIRWVERVNFVI